MERPKPENYGLTEQEVDELRQQLDSRSLGIGGRIAVVGVVVLCIYTAVTEGLLVSFLLTISAGLFFLLIGSVVIASVIERVIVAVNRRMARLHQYELALEEYRILERRLASQNALPRDIQRIVDGEAGESEARQTISKYIGTSNW